VFSRDCPKLKEEKRIMEIKTTEKLPYAEARKKYRQLIAPTFSRSFASVAANPIKKFSVSTQTEADKQDNNNRKPRESEKTKPEKATKPAKVNITNTGPSKKNTPKTSKPTSPRREKTPSPGPSSNSNRDPEESMEEECLSETEVFRLREKGRRHRIRR
jgi:hypothetical protein